MSMSSHGYLFFKKKRFKLENRFPPSVFNEFQISISKGVKTLCFEQNKENPTGAWLMVSH